jgi:MFS family permease
VAAAASPGPLGPAFTRLLSASVATNLADGVSTVALPLVAAELTRSPAAVAGVALAQRLPWLLFSLLAGAVVDRCDRRALLWRTDAGRACVLAVLAAASAAGALNLPALYGLAFALGAAETVRDNTAQTILPSVVRRDRLEAANGRLMAAEILTNQLAGPPLGGLLVAGAAWLAFAFDAALFAGAALLMAGMAGTFAPPDRGPARPRVMADIAEGMRWLWAHATLRTLALLLGTFNLLGTAAFSVLVLLAQDKLGLGELGFGLLFASGAVGGAVSGLVAARVVARIGRSAMLVGAATAFGLAQLAMGLVRSPWAFAALFLVDGAAMVAWNVVTVSLRQAIVPDALLGRVNSAYRFFGWGAMPIGAGLGGVLAEAGGVAAPFVAGGAGMVAATLVCLRRLLQVDGTVAGPDQAPDGFGS